MGEEIVTLEGVAIVGILANYKGSRVVGGWLIVPTEYWLVLTLLWLNIL